MIRHDGKAVRGRLPTEPATPLRRPPALRAGGVAAGFDQLARLGEVGSRRGPGVGGRAAGGEAEQAGAMQTDVRQKQPHRPPLGDLIGLVEILAGAVEIAGDGAVEGAGKETTGEVVLRASATQDADGRVDVLGGRRLAAQHGGVEGGAGEREVVEADVLPPTLTFCDLERLGRPRDYLVARGK